MGKKVSKELKSEDIISFPYSLTSNKKLKKPFIFRQIFSNFFGILFGQNFGLEQKCCLILY